MALWRAFVHDAFGVAKGVAYSGILTLFPALIVVASVLATVQDAEDFILTITLAVGRIFPPGAARAISSYFEGADARPIRTLIWTSALTLWTASGVMLSWMDGFRAAYGIPKSWGIVKERFIAFGLVIMAGIPLAFATFLVAFGNQIEQWMNYNTREQYEPLILLTWTILRWVIAITSSIAVMTLTYHHAVPRTLRWHTVLPGAALATGVWFPATILFGWYVRHYAQYSLLYGSMATAIVTLVWMYILSCIVLIGAEFNALLFPRAIVSDKNAKTNPRTPAPKVHAS